MQEMARRCVLMTIQQFESDIERYKNMIYGIALTQLCTVSDADDVFQDVFLLYFSKDPAFTDDEHRKAWLINTALNFCKRANSGHKRRKLPPPEERFTYRTDEENRLFEALLTLPKKYRVPLYLHYFTGMPIAEIARILGVRYGTVQVQLVRGRNKLKDILGGDSYEK